VAHTVQQGRAPASAGPVVSIQRTPADAAPAEPVQERKRGGIQPFPEELWHDPDLEQPILSSHLGDATSLAGDKIREGPFVLGPVVDTTPIAGVPNRSVYGPFFMWGEGRGLHARVTHWMLVRDLPKGQAFRRGEWWIFFDGRSVQAFKRYPESEGAVMAEAETTHREPRAPRSEAHAGGVLNRDIQAHLEKGEPLEQAHDQTRFEEQEVLRTMASGTAGALMANVPAEMPAEAAAAIEKGLNRAGRALGKALPGRKLPEPELPVEEGAPSSLSSEEKLRKLRQVGDPKRVQESIANDKAFRQRQQDTEKLVADDERLQKDLATAKISREKFDSMRTGAPVRAGERLPLPFQSWEEFDQFRREFAEIVAKIRVNGKPITARARVIGTSSTFYSNNPKNELGHHFDRRAQGPEGKRSDVDIELNSPELVEHMLGKDPVLNEKVVIGGEKVLFKNVVEKGPGRGFQQEFPQFGKFSEKWSAKEKLNREVDVKLKAELTPIEDLPKGERGPIEIYRSEKKK
jgi:hypothetical protein